MAKQKPEVRLKKHHWIGSFRAKFVLPDNPDVGTFEHNAMLTNSRPFVTANMIGQAQQAVQLQLFQQYGHPQMKILDVHVQGVSYLGCMAQEEFYTPPPADEAAPAGEPEEPADNDPFALKGPVLN